MSQQMTASKFQEVIDQVEALPPDDQALVIDIVRQRLIQRRRGELAQDIAETRAAYKRGDVRRGTADDLIAELAE